MKRSFITVFALILAIGLAGCGKNSGNSGADTPSDTSESIQNTLNQNHGSVTPTGSANANPPEQGIYTSCENYDVRIYPINLSQSFIFYIMSEKPLPDDVKFEADADIACQGYIEEKAAGQINENTFPYYLYACYRGMDWKQLAQKDQELKAACEAEEKAKSEEAEEAVLQKLETERERLAKEYQDLRSKYEEDYRAYINGKNTAQPFHWYEIAVNFNTEKLTENKTIHELKLSAGEWTVSVPIGNLEFICDQESQIAFSGKGIQQRMQAMGGLVTTPWGTETQRIEGLMLIQAEENIVLKQLYVYNGGNDSSNEIAQAEITLQTDGGTQEFVWKEGDDILVRSGESISFDIVLHDSKMTEAEYGTKKILVLEYELDGERYYTKMEMDLTRERMPWEVYAWRFQGIDTQSYFEDYYNICVRDTEL